MNFSDAEWQIMNALWKRHPATAREIIENIPGEVKWAYTTVKTMLARLVTKKAVSDQKRGNTSEYRPLISQKKSQRSALVSLFDKVLDGAIEPLMHFLVEDKKLSLKERKELIRILGKTENIKEDKK